MKSEPNICITTGSVFPLKAKFSWAKSQLVITHCKVQILRNFQDLDKPHTELGNSLLQPNDRSMKQDVNFFEDHLFFQEKLHRIYSTELVILEIICVLKINYSAFSAKTLNSFL